MSTSASGTGRPEAVRLGAVRLEAARLGTVRPVRILSLPSGRTIRLGAEPCIMGIVNCTPDSFWQGSRAPDPVAARDAALAQLDEGAAIVDFGAESTRPGSAPVTEEEELARLIPAIRAFRKSSNAPVSVDTRHGPVARAALAEGADIVNDIAALADPESARAAREYGAAVVLMHMRGEPATMQAAPEYADCAAEVAGFLRAAAERALAAGIPRNRIVLDPGIGIGFGKNMDHNLDIFRRLDLLLALGYPILIGHSRKRFIADITSRHGGLAAPSARLPGSLGAGIAAWLSGADMLRVHDVAATRESIAVFSACRGRPGSGPYREEPAR